MLSKLGLGLSFVLLSFYSASADERGIGEFACNDTQPLEITLEQLVPVDKNGEPLVGCTFLPGDYEPIVLATVRIVDAYCGNDIDGTVLTCTVEIQQARTDDRLYYIADGWLDGLAGDISGDLLFAGVEPIVPIGTPCDIAACDILSETGEVMIAGDKTDRLPHVQAIAAAD